ncbi:MAG: right-handed parallel beta-helix repeat-containing protein [Candidatus Eisenbacteria bacterium]|nr:right-handed parallel beta-helix repeat-containing protein [Candidatus Eisenbacteria bacterium]
MSLSRAGERIRSATRAASVTLCAAVLCVGLCAALCAGASAAILYVENLSDAVAGTGSQDDPFRRLQDAIDSAADGDILIIGPGTYSAEPTAFTEPLCGNCEAHITNVAATTGFRVVGKALRMVGSGTSETILRTNAGYGLYFEDSAGSVVEALMITGGVRDPDGAATDAAVVARRSSVTLKGLLIADNTNRAEDVVVGIGGVMGREGAELTVTGNTIRNNGWDGVALYRGAAALISDNEIAQGRGAGVGVTWDAVATVLRNDIHDYWKGIGSFGSSRVVARNNTVHDNLGWGIVVTGTSFMEAANNAVVKNGNCGFALWSDDASCVFTNNIVVGNGWRDEWVCPQVGVWMNGAAANAEITYNDVWGNVADEFRDMEAVTGIDGNISLDPAFEDSLDFHLREGSPCIDTGNPVFTDPDGGPADMGAFGGPQSH